MKDKKLNEVLEEIKTLDDLLTERIVDLHGEKGLEQASHAYIFCRSILWGIRDKINGML